MAFWLFVQYLGDHFPELGVLVCLIAFGAGIAVVSYRTGYRNGRKYEKRYWEDRVKNMPQLISQEIRQRLEKSIEYWRGRCEAMKERITEELPLFRGVAFLMQKKTDQLEEETKES